MKWNYTYISSLNEMILSGWKLYVYGETIDDSRYVADKITPIVGLYNATIKVATEDIIERNNKIKPAWGIAVIYLHKELFECNLIGCLIASINNSLSRYSKSGYYNGSRPLTDNLSYRYDLIEPIVASVGLQYEDYLTKYRGEFGHYNIENNQIPKQLIIN